VLIYALIPGHNFGLAIIIFTILVRLMLWPLVKKQLHQTKLMRRIQPDLKRIAKETKGDRQKQALMQMELYKEKGISPFRSIGVVLLQFPILIGLYLGLQKVTKDPHQIIDFAYPALQNLPWMQKLADNIKLFDSSLFGLVDLHRSAIGPAGLYIPALIIVIASVIVQYIQAKQLMPNDKDARSLRSIMKDAGKGKQADQAEVGAAVGKFTILLLPGMIFIFTVGIASALSLYWFVGGLVAFIQQSIVLREDTEEMEELSETTTDSGKRRRGSKVVTGANGSKVTIAGAKDVDDIPEAEIVTTETTVETHAKTKPTKKSSKKSKKRRRK
jgi:YidC/Oxa1 family membrane protein insertase